MREIGQSLRVASRDEITAAKLMEIGSDLARIHEDLLSLPSDVFSAKLEQNLIDFKSEAYSLADEAEEIQNNRFKKEFYKRAMNLGLDLIAFASLLSSLAAPVMSSENIFFFEKILDGLSG